MTEELIAELARDATPRERSTAFVAEQPEHIKILVLKAEGRSTRTIAQTTGYTKEYVRLVARQPWFQEKYRRYIALSGNEFRMKLFEREFEDSLETLVELRDSAKSETVRKDSAIQILDRIMGKPVQQVANVTNEQRDLADLTEEQRALAEERDELERRLQHEYKRMGNGTNTSRGDSPPIDQN